MSCSRHGRVCPGHPRGSACTRPECLADRAPTVSETAVWLGDVDGRDNPGHDGTAPWIVGIAFHSRGPAEGRCGTRNDGLSSIDLLDSLIVGRRLGPAGISMRSERSRPTRDAKPVSSGHRLVFCKSHLCSFCLSKYVLSSFHRPSPLR